MVTVPALASIAVIFPMPMMGPDTAGVVAVIGMLAIGAAADAEVVAAAGSSALGEHAAKPSAIAPRPAIINPVFSISDSCFADPGFAGRKTRPAAAADQ